jgi:hypothetical protein
MYAAYNSFGTRRPYDSDPCCAQILRNMDSHPRRLSTVVFVLLPLDAIDHILSYVQTRTRVLVQLKHWLKTEITFLDSTSQKVWFFYAGVIYLDLPFRKKSKVPLELHSRLRSSSAVDSESAVRARRCVFRTCEMFSNAAILGLDELHAMRQVREMRAGEV